MSDAAIAHWRSEMGLGIVSGALSVAPEYSHGRWYNP